MAITAAAPTSRISDLSGRAEAAAAAAGMPALPERRSAAMISRRHRLKVPGSERVRLRFRLIRTGGAGEWRESASRSASIKASARDFKPPPSMRWKKSDSSRRRRPMRLPRTRSDCSRSAKKYAPLMSESADRLAFDIAAPAGAPGESPTSTQAGRQVRNARRTPDAR